MQHCKEFFSLPRQMYFHCHFSPPEREIRLLHRLVLEGEEFEGLKTYAEFWFDGESVGISDR